MKKMTSFKSYFEDRNIKVHSEEKLSNARFFRTNNGNYIAKKKGITDIHHLYNYLSSRSFTNFPNMIKKINEDYETYYLYNYLEDVKLRDEQRVNDLIDIVANLHKKTVFHKQVPVDHFKKIYENVLNDINYLKAYCGDIITVIENKVYFSPSEQLFARNYSLLGNIFHQLDEMIKNWYESVKDERSIREVTIHGNLSFDHVIVTKENSHLVSWDQSMINMPLIDLIKLYRSTFRKFDFKPLLEKYETIFPLTDSERGLFFVLILLPEKIIFNRTELAMTKYLTNYFYYLTKTNELIKDHQSPQEEEQETKLDPEDEDVNPKGQEESNDQLIENSN